VNLIYLFFHCRQVNVYADSRGINCDISSVKKYFGHKLKSISIFAKNNIADMTVHNKAQLRYRILDKCFRDTNKDYTLNELLQTVNELLKNSEHPHTISERQLYSDIAYMKSDAGFGAEIESYRVGRTDPDGTTRFYAAYRYKDPRYSIERIPLSHQQMRYLQAFISSFDASVNPDIAPWVKKTIAKVRDWIGNFNTKPIFRYDNREYQGGVRMKEVYDFFRLLLEAIDNHKSVLLYVKSFDEEQWYRYHPFYLKQFMNRWHVLGVTTDHPDKVEAIPLDKIYSITLSPDEYINYNFDADEYFEDFIGVTDPGGEPADIHFQLFEWGAYYLWNNPIHASQRAKWIEVDGEKVLDVHISVKINSELTFVLAKFAECIKIISPQAVLDDFRHALQKAISRNGLS